MTPERLEAIRARAEAATPGPWRIEEDEDGYWAVSFRGDGVSTALHNHVGIVPRKEDAEAILFAIDDRRALLAALDEARADADRLAEVLRRSPVVVGETATEATARWESERIAALAAHGEATGAEATIGPIQHMESQTVECWCRHCVWWAERHKAAERARLAGAAWSAHNATGHTLDYSTCIQPSCRASRWLLAEPAPAP